MAESTASGRLVIHLNQESLHSIEIPESFETADSFVIELDNHGEAAHVHLRLDDALSEIASLPASNHYVRPGAVTRVPISIHDDGPVGGTLTVATAYGSETEDIEVIIGPTAGKKRVEIDDSLIERSGGGNTTATPPPRSPSRSAGGMTAGIGTPVQLGGAAVLILIGIVLLFVGGIAPYLGALAVIVGFLIAAYLLLY
ncbi:MAG TPA: hypothetical protein VFJ06_10455 [Halococcus sp.]|nr:hypothetical protein [Halococcus sp.]